MIHSYHNNARLSREEDKGHARDQAHHRRGRPGARGLAGIVGKRRGAGEVHGRLRAGLRAVAAAGRGVRYRDGDRDHAGARLPPHPGGEPVVLLTGAGGNAAHWYPHVAAIAEAGPVYGIDMPGDANPSVPRAPLTPPESCAAWLDELLGKLSDRPAHLVGFSYGGWVAMNQAIARPRGSPPSRCSTPPGSPGPTPGSTGGSPFTPAQARARGSLMPHAEVAIVPGSHGGFNRIDELNDRIAAFIQAHATGKQAAADTG
jgi:alpha/beta hydrolase family protein